MPKQKDVYSVPSWNWWLALAAFLFVILGIAAFAFVPSLLISLGPHSDELSAAEAALALSTTRQSVLLGLGGLLAVMGLVLSFHRHGLEKLSARQIDREFGEKRLREREDYGLREDENRTSRYTSAIAQLASENADVQLGGVYALARLARDSSADAVVVYQVLAASLARRGAGREERSRAESYRREKLDQVERAIFDVLLPQKTQGLHLVGLDLTGENLENAYLAGANLNKVAFSNANLRGANLRGARLTNAYLDGADLTSADLGESVLSGTNPSSAASLRQVSFRDADIFMSRWTLLPSEETRREPPYFGGAHWMDEPGVPEGLTSWTASRYVLDGMVARLPYDSPR